MGICVAESGVGAQSLWVVFCSRLQTALKIYDDIFGVGVLYDTHTGMNVRIVSVDT